MNKEENNGAEKKNKFFFFIKENKIKLLITASVIFLSVISFYLFKIYNLNKNDLISEKYIQAGIYLNLKNEKKSLEIYDEIINEKNKFYSVLSLNTVIEKKLVKDHEKIINYFEIVEEMNISKEQKVLVMFKKALYLINANKLIEGKEILNKIILSDSKLKIFAEELINNI
jgi:tetratricopeptide (TPR) repeat protein|tara:strand:- start:11 stop:523 length:513 start_codon:yes stop_codon:yes gene_type:complete